MENPTINAIIREAIQAASTDYLNETSIKLFKDIIVIKLTAINPSMFFTEKSIDLLHTTVIENKNNTEIVSNFIYRLMYELETRQTGILEEILRINKKLTDSLQKSQIDDTMKDLYKTDAKYETTYYALYYILVLNINYLHRLIFNAMPQNAKRQ